MLRSTGSDLDSASAFRLSELQRLVPADSLVGIRQYAWSLRAQLPFILKTPDWPSQIRDELLGQTAGGAIKAGGMDIELLLQLVLLLMAEDSQADLRDMLEAAAANSQREQMREAAMRGKLG